MKAKTLLSATAASLFVFAIANMNSGLEKGDKVTPFHPKHVNGALKGSDSCFPCTYQNRPQVQIWVNEHDPKTVMAFAQTLDEAMKANANAEFKAMIVLIADKEKGMMIEKSAPAMLKGLNHVDVAYVSPNDKAIKAYKINMDSEVKNTVFAYKNWTVVNKLVNVKADKAGLEAINNAVNSVVNSR